MTAAELHSSVFWEHFDIFFITFFEIFVSFSLCSGAFYFDHPTDYAGSSQTVNCSHGIPRAQMLAVVFISVDSRIASC